MLRIMHLGMLKIIHFRPIRARGLYLLRDRLWPTRDGSSVRADYRLNIILSFSLEIFLSDLFVEYYVCRADDLISLSARRHPAGVDL
jgi:hypothetical protein